MEIFVSIWLSLSSASITFVIIFTILKVRLKRNGFKFSTKINVKPILLGCAIVFVGALVLIFIAKSIATHSYPYDSLIRIYYGTHSYTNENEFFPLLFTFLPINLILGIIYTYKMSVKGNELSMTNN